MNAIAVRDLTVHYEGRPWPALADLSLNVPAGELVVVAGPSGAGKSTLFHALLGFVPEGIPARVAGEVFLFGQPAPPSLYRRADGIGLVQQDPEAQICTLRVRDEVAFGPENLGLPRAEIAGRVETALATVGLTALADRATWTLSGGEKQRLSLASALALAPKVLLLDEPTAHLDPSAAAGLLGLVAELHEEGRTVIVAEHRLGPLARLRPRFLWLAAGRLAADRYGIPQEAALADDFPRPAPFRGGRLLVVRGLSFAYPGGNDLFRRLSFDLAPGEILGVIGPNGAGKTTLLRLLAGLTSPHAGTIALAAGHRPGDGVGLVFQMPHHQLFAASVAEELALGRPRVDGDGRAWLARAGLVDLAHEHPLRLSVGERRRLTVILALSRRPRLLLLDEPFIGQDWANRRWIASELVRAVQEGSGAILVSHDIPAVARLAHRVLYLGEEALLGSPGEVFRTLASQGRDAFTPEFWEAR